MPNDDHGATGQKGPSLWPVCDSECKCHGCGLYWCSTNTHCPMCKREQELERRIATDKVAILQAASELSDALDSYDRRRHSEEAKKIHVAEQALRHTVLRYRQTISDYNKIKKE